MANINSMAVASGRKLKENNTVVNTADMLEAIYNSLVVNKNAGMKIQGSNYQDLGQVVEGLNMAAGATVYSPYYTDLEWVRNVICLAQSDQQYDIGHQRKDTSGAIDSTNNTIGSNLSALLAPNYRSTTNPSLGIGLLGYSTRFYIKNSSASANTYARLRVQLIGL